MVGIMQTHYSHDFGTAPTPNHPKTTQTLCGLRAPYSRIDNTSPTCPDCLAGMQEVKKLPQTLGQLLNEFSL
jgi:hypothetical protein